MPVVQFEISDEGRATLQRHAERGSALIANLNQALQQGLDEFAAELKNKHLSGGNWREKRGGRTPLAVRSGLLRQSIIARRDGDLTGVFGSGKGAASKYAAVQLDNETRTITPKNAKYLAIPIADGLTPSGLPNALTIGGPREVQGLKIFKSKNGNLVGFLPDAGYKFSATSGAKHSVARYERGPRKGQAKGKLLFVFKKSITVQGSDALAKSVDSKRFVFRNLIQVAANDALIGGDNV